MKSKKWLFSIARVSIIIPCYQEEKFIEKCLDSLINNNYPKEKLEILVIDGGSSDKTREIIKEYAKKHSFIKVLDSPRRFPAFALNKGIKRAKGKFIIRCDAHSEYPENYIEKLVFWLGKDKSIGNVGGIFINSPAGKGLQAKSIAYALNHFFCVGWNKYRTKKSGRVLETDTVPFGAWRKEIFNEMGFFDEKFLLAQDLEFNLRLKKAEYKILLDPEIKIYYYPRENFKDLFSMFFQYGYWKVIVNKKFKKLSSLRQLVPPLFVIYFILGILLSPFYFRAFFPIFFYLFLCLLFAFTLAVKHRDVKLPPFIFQAFIISHFGFGLGYLKGFFDIFLLRKEERPNKNYTQITR